MTLRGFLAVLLRRWLVLVPALLLTAGAAVALVATTPPEYTAGGSFVMLPPALDTTTGRVANPYLAFDSSLRVTGDILSQSVTDDRSVADVVRQGGTAAYTVQAPTDTAGPEVVVSTNSKARDAADRTLALVRTQLMSRLQAIQESANAPRNTWIRVSPLSTTPAKRQLKGAIRTAVVVGAVGVALSVVTAFLVEGRSRRRKAVRATRKPDPYDPAFHAGGFSDETDSGSFPASYSQEFPVDSTGRYVDR